jgi:hypothetical protein
VGRKNLIQLKPRISTFETKLGCESEVEDYRETVLEEEMALDMPSHLPGFKVWYIPATDYGARLIRELEYAAGPERSSAGPPARPRPSRTAQQQKEEEQQQEKDPTNSSQPPTKASSTPHEDNAEEIGLLSDPLNQYIAVSDLATDQPVGYVWWQHHYGRTEAEWEEGDKRRHRPRHMDPALQQATGGARYRKRAIILGIGMPSVSEKPHPGILPRLWQSFQFADL